MGDSQHGINEGREEEEKEKEKEKGNSEKDRITRGYGYCVAKRSLYLKGRGDGSGPCVRRFGDEGIFVLV